MPSNFVSGLPGPPAPQPGLSAVLKRLEANVKGFGSRATPKTQAATLRLLGEHDAPAPERYIANNKGQFRFFD